MSSPEQPIKLSLSERQQLLDLAEASVRHGLEHGAALPVDEPALSPALRAIRATFVTIEKARNLRGCIGSLNPVRPLAVDIAENAFMAAFEDPRFPAVSETEVHELDIHLSILSPLEEVIFSSEEELRSRLRPGVDGLMIKEGAQRATFLPSVWESLPDPVEFLRYLKAKAGWAENYWSDGIRASRYTTEMIP